jgi:hypothetical protein
LFHRLPNGTHFGLPDWYEEIAKRAGEPADKPNKSKRRAKPKKAKKKSESKESPAMASQPQVDEPEKQSPPPSDKKANGKPTVISAVREGILAMKGEFTKQDVVDWIGKRYPDLKAPQRKTSIYSMITDLKGDLKLVTAKAGKGTEPHRFRRAENSDGETVG